MPKNWDWLDGIEKLETNHVLARKENENEDLNWLTAGDETDHNFLEGIEKLESAEATPLMKSFVRQGILEIVKKKAAGKQLTQPELIVLQNFIKSFPDIDINELEEAANALK
ncbi:hypothetical protein AB7942_24005 [Neobacillus sp. BF23-41]|uniref:hypothetical protein n=1 Tax=Neobacillus sp. BF23-41 TaxID=3240280 RepID=UPI0034E4B8BA